MPADASQSNADPLGSVRDSSGDRAAVPSRLKLKLEEQTLAVEWPDGLAATFPAGFLRRHCPCATCRTAASEKTLLPILNIRGGQTPRIVSARLAGTYALQLSWSDGHDAGIFDFRLLRSLASQAPFAPKPATSTSGPKT